MAKYDLTPIIGCYLDRHLVFPILEFFSNKTTYRQEEINKARFEIGVKTSLLDFCIDLCKVIDPEKKALPELLEKRDKVVNEYNTFNKATEHIRALVGDAFKDPTVINLVNTVRDVRIVLDHLIKYHDYKTEYVDILYKYAIQQFDSGNYENSAEYLNLCQLLVPLSDKGYINFMWGKLASEILIQNWDVALEDCNRLRDFIDQNIYGYSALAVLQQRTWLIHWSLFVFFNHAKGQDLIIDMFLFQPQYLNAIQTTCPHILRYLTTAVITNKQRPSVMKELVKVIQQESYAYKDPITEFVECLYVNFDFDGAQKKLRECQIVLRNDFFIVSCEMSFIEEARLVIFETFCCIHQCISITMLAEKLNMVEGEAEKWIVNMIRNSRLHAKIDSQLGHVVMSLNTLSPYHQLIEKTKVLSFRAQLMTSNLEKKMSANLPERVPYWATQEF